MPPPRLDLESGPRGTKSANSMLAIHVIARRRRSTILASGPLSDFMAASLIRPQAYAMARLARVRSALRHIRRASRISSTGIAPPHMATWRSWVSPWLSDQRSCLGDRATE